jgi:hypothetical protein
MSDPSAVERTDEDSDDVARKQADLTHRFNIRMDAMLQKGWTIREDLRMVHPPSDHPLAGDSISMYVDFIYLGLKDGPCVLSVPAFFWEDV